LVPELRRDVLGQPLRLVLKEFTEPEAAAVSSNRVDESQKSFVDASNSLVDTSQRARRTRAERRRNPSQPLTKISVSTKRSTPRVARGWDEPLTLLRGDADAPSHIEARAAPLQRFDGEFAGLVAVFADITQRRQVEQPKAISCRSWRTKCVRHSLRFPGFRRCFSAPKAAPARFRRRRANGFWDSFIKSRSV
jgi:hypothetical protein